MSKPSHWPLALRELLEVGAFAVFGAVLARSGDAHMAAHVVAIRLVAFSFLIGHGIAQGGAVLVGQAIGAGRPELARQALVASMGLAVPVMTVMGGVFVAVPEAMLAIFDAGPPAHLRIC